MRAPEIPRNEAKRLAALEELLLLDTPAEERFDRITRLARRLFDVPIALISLVDAKRLWFKSAHGLAATETPRDISFCGHTILREEPLIVPDAQRDDRFAGNPFVRGEPHIRFYAGAPLAAPDGHRVGALCIIDRSPREMTEPDVLALRDLAAIVESEFEVTRLGETERDLRERLAQAERKASIDTVTRVWNRDTILGVLRGECAHAVRQEDPLGVALVGLVGFQRLPETHGARAADVALRVAADRIRSALRPYDSLGRFGGTEFLIVLPGADRKSTQRVGERVRRRIGERPITRLDEVIRMTASIGTTSYGGSGPLDQAKLVQAAQRALTRAEDSGRNRVVFQAV